MRQSQVLILNSAVIWCSRILLLFPQLFLVPYLIKTIGESGYGTYALVWSLLLSLDQVTRSLQSGVVKYCAGFMATKKIDKVNEIVNASFVFSLGITLMISSSFFILSLNVEKTSISEAMQILSLLVLLILPLTPLIALIQACQIFYIGAITDTISKFLGLAIIVTLFSVGFSSVNVVICVMTLMILLSRLLQLPFVYRNVPLLKVKLSCCTLGGLRTVSSFGFITVVGAICLTVNSTGSRWAMGVLESTDFVTEMVIMWMPAMLLNQLVSDATVTIVPATSAQDAKGGKEELRKFMIRGVRYTVVLVATATIVATYLMNSFVTLWVGSEYVSLVQYANILVLSTSIMLSTAVCHHMMKGLGRLKTVVVIYFIGLVVVPIVIFIFMREMQTTAHYMLVAGLASGHLVCGLLNVKFCIDILGIELKAVFVESYAKPLATVLSCGIMWWFFVSLLDVEGVISELLLSFILITLVIFSCYVTLLDLEDRQELRFIAKAVIGKLRMISSA